jgi:phosphoribosylformimino-5-aminoimidazole carboxamide ribonucleotide (ProFAR) isomerase
MDRLVYNSETKEIITRIVNSEGTCTGTPFDMFEDTPEKVDAKIKELSLVYPANN